MNIHRKRQYIIKSVYVKFFQTLAASSNVAYCHLISAKEIPVMPSMQKKKIKRNKKTYKFTQPQLVWDRMLKQKTHNQQKKDQKKLLNQNKSP